MNFKDLFFVAFFALVISWGVDYFFLSRHHQDGQEQDLQSGQMFSLPEAQQRSQKPLCFDIKFSSEKRTSREMQTDIDTEWGSLLFSSEGASLERLEFKHKVSDSDGKIITIYPAAKREQKAFLVALSELTPYYFTLVEHKDNEHTVNLVYEGLFEHGLLRKLFTIDKHHYRIDLLVELMLNSSYTKDSHMRILWPAPIMPDVKYDTISGVVANAKGTVEKVVLDKLNSRTGWWSPTLFGAENKYFVHAEISQNANDIERAYYMMPDNQQLISIIETVAMSKDKYQVKLSFYCGPKDADAMSKVDVRLEDLLDYSGILAPLSKLLLRILKFLYNYVANYGLAIFLLTFLMKLTMLPFTINNEKNMKKSAEMQKKFQHLQQKFKNDPERLRVEQAELIRRHGIPQLVSLIPMLLQLPIFIALSRVLSNSIDLYKAPFFWWITDLSVPDPYYVFPILLVICMMFQALLMDQQQPMMMIGMALLFGAFSVHFAAGLVLYIVVSTFLTVAQTALQRAIRI